MKKTTSRRKHFIIYYKKGTGTYVVTEPKPWSRENQHHFQGYDFAVTPPTTEEINTFLIDNFHFQREDHNNPDITVLSNLNPHINL